MQYLTFYALSTNTVYEIKTHTTLDYMEKLLNKDLPAFQ